MDKKSKLIYYASVLTYIFNVVEIKMSQVSFLEQNTQIDSKNQMEEQILKNNKNNYMKEKTEKGTCPAIYQGAF